MVMVVVLFNVQEITALLDNNSKIHFIKNNTVYNFCVSKQMFYETFVLTGLK